MYILLSQAVILCSYLNHLSKKILIMILKNGFNSPSDQTNILTTLILFINKTHRFYSIFGFYLVGLKVSFSSCFKDVLWQVVYDEHSWCFLIRNFLLYFNSLLLFLYYSASSAPFFFKPLVSGYLNPFFICPFRS